MGQKVHPLGFRLGVTQKHRAQWFIHRYLYAYFVVEDNLLRQTLLKNFAEAKIESIEIERQVSQVLVNIQAARPRALLGAYGRGLEKLRHDLSNLLNKTRKENSFQFIRNKSNSISPIHLPFNMQDNIQVVLNVTKSSDTSSAALLADFIVDQLERRVPFRRVLRLAVQRAKQVNVKGIKIQISGRLNGAEIARSEWVRKGQVPLQTLRAQLDYSCQKAQTIYGVLGIKVWIFYGMKNEIDAHASTESVKSPSGGAENM